MASRSPHKEHFENRPIPRPVPRHRRVRGGDVRPTGPRLEHDHDDYFEFQCSVYDLYNRGGDIKHPGFNIKFDEYVYDYDSPGFRAAFEQQCRDNRFDSWFYNDRVNCTVDIDHRADDVSG